MLTLEQVKERLKDRRLDMVSESTGLSVGTVARVRDGKGDPTLKTLAALSDYLEGRL